MVKVNTHGDTSRCSSKSKNIAFPMPNQNKKIKIETIEGQEQLRIEKKDKNWKKTKKSNKMERKIQKALKKKQKTKKPQKIDKNFFTRLNKKIFNQIQTATKKEQTLENKQKEQQIDIEQYLNEAVSPPQRSSKIIQQKKLSLCQKLLMTLTESKEQNVNQLIHLKYTEQIINKTLKTYLELFLQSSNPSISQYQNILNSCRNQEQLLNIIAVIKKIETHPYYISLNHSIKQVSNKDKNQKLIQITIKPNYEENQEDIQQSKTQQEMQQIDSLSNLHLQHQDHSKDNSLELVNYLSNDSSSHSGKNKVTQKIWDSELQDNNYQDILQ